MVKKNKEILKQAGVMSFLYLILCLGGAYESYYRGADLKLTARIAGCVLLLMWGGIFIFIIKKEYDSRKYLGYIYLCDDTCSWLSCRIICNKEDYCEE